ncbi:MAG: family 78 glycoside hydrolase catalytic domain [Saprospiraceae bacterium]|nr:family 78 glycoside hydrolase catalytic domain [Saprospiraceae bacterium]
MLPLNFIYGEKETEGTLKVEELRCEYAINPLGIDIPMPRFSWILKSDMRGQMQSAFQIMVSDDLDRLNRDIGNKWNSKKIATSNSVNIPYQGPSLTSGERSFWKVRVWDEKGEVSDWSEPATFEMGLMNEEDWEGKWIGTRLFNDLSYTDGKAGEAVSLNGTDQPIKARFHRLAKLEDGITISAWVKPDEFTDEWQTIYRKDDGVATQVLAIGSKHGEKGIWFGLGVSGVYTEDCAILPDDFFADGRWHHISVSYDRIAKRIYLDGKEIKTFTNPGLIYPRGYATAYIGSHSNQEQFFKGGIDELSIYRNALPEESIIEVMNNNILTNDLAGWWRFDGTLANNYRHRSDPSGDAQLLRKEFVIDKKISRARIYFSGLGLSECYINGDKISDDVISPAFTDYHRLVKYMTYDITDQLVRGKNAVGVFLGNGWYSAKVLDYAENWSDKSQLLLQMNIEFEDGTTMHLSSDKTWKYSYAPMEENDMDFGEKYDARKEQDGWSEAGFDDHSWLEAEESDGPSGLLSAQIMPAMKVVETLRPIKITEPKPGIFVCHFDQLFGGWIKLNIKGKPGDEIMIDYSTRLLKNGMIDEGPWPGEQERDYYILKGDPSGESYQPRFVYHPVQYVQLVGCSYKPSPDDIQGQMVRNDENLRGDFTCSNDLFNAIHDNVNRTLSNSLKGFLLDCLHREPYGYNEPASIAASLFTRKHMPLFWRKYATDIRLAARQDGSVGDVIPAFPGKPRDPDVSQGSAYAMLVWYLYQAYDDRSLLDEHYETIKNWVDYIKSNMCEGSIVTIGWLGDHMVPGHAPGYEKWRSDETPPSLSWTALYYRNILIVSEMARVLGLKADQLSYTQLAQEVKSAFNEKWLDKSTGHYGSKSQTAELLPLSIGLVPDTHREKLIKNIAQNIIGNDNSHLRVGHAGITALIESLTANGLGKVMYDIVNTTTYPGWGYMVDQGATTIWESWGRDYAVLGGRRRSDNMTMLAGVNEYFYHFIAGIQGPNFYGASNMEPGYQEFRIKPYPLKDLTFAKASVHTVRGEIRSSWNIEDSTFTIDVVIPANSEAFLSIPKSGKKDVVISENDMNVWANNKFHDGVEGVLEGLDEGEYIMLKVGSGRYSFKLSEVL